jgi:hypothetical protein
MADKLTPKEGRFGREAVHQLLDILGLPDNTVGFTLRVYSGQFVTIECEFVLGDGSVGPVLTEYDLTPQS